MNLFVFLKYLVALDDHRHFGQAALASCITQPALSNALRALEENFETAIVKRGRNFAGFTIEGERILASARRILRKHKMLQQDLHSRAYDPKGHLLIGAGPTAIPITARFAAMLQDRHPGIVPTLRSMSSVELETGLESLPHEYEHRSSEGADLVRERSHPDQLRALGLAGSVGGGGGLTTIRSALDPIVVSSNVPSGPFNRRLYAQCHGEHRAAHAVAAIGRPNVATVTLDDGAADPQPESGAILLARDKGLEQFGQ
ncbi:MAG TPA: LysR family transcriptional regulator [Burkholderiaceae bacterium]|jgi:hypothetical protein